MYIYSAAANGVATLCQTLDSTPSFALFVYYNSKKAKRPGDGNAVAQELYGKFTFRMFLIKSFVVSFKNAAEVRGKDSNAISRASRAVEKRRRDKNVCGNQIQMRTWAIRQTTIDSHFF